MVLYAIREVHGDILLVGDREKDMRTERDVFFGDFIVTTPQRRSSPHTHTLTNTHTHMTGQPWLVSGSRGVFRVFRFIF